jgi:outer membrane protein assembly factor BamD
MNQFFTMASLALCATLLFTGCAGSKIDETDPVAVYEDAETDIHAGRYLVAIEKLRRIRSRFPYSNYSAKAQVRLGDVYFYQKSYPEAAAAYETFRSLHPRHEKAAYALFQIGESHFQASPKRVARDLSFAERSLSSFEFFLERYPQNENEEAAQKRVAQIKEMLAEKQMDIADYYYGKKRWEAAKGRYTRVINQYPNTLVAKDAKRRLDEVSNKDF